MLLALGEFPAPFITGRHGCTVLLESHLVGLISEEWALSPF